MVQLVADAMREAGIDKIVVVVGHGGEAIVTALGDTFEYAWQVEQKGTGHAVVCASEALAGFDGLVVIAPGDTTLVEAEFFRNLVDYHVGQGARCTVATAIQDDPTGYGRMLRDEFGNLAGIVEHKDATPEQLTILEVNAGIYCVESLGIFEILAELKSNNSQGEYYLTDIVKLLNAREEKVSGFVVADSDILVGINDKWQLAQAGKKLNMKLLEAHARNGVTFIDPDSVYLSPYVQIGRDTVIEPNCYLYGRTTIGENSHIGPSTRLINTQVGAESLVLFTNAVSCQIGRDVKVGPFANIRPKSVLGDEVNIGNFVEINRSELANDVSARHLTYIGDSYVGEGTNIGAGTITCNYDGFNKHRTHIGRDAFIGSNSTLVAPVIIGDRAIVTAGSVITNNLPADAAGFARSQQITKEGWAISFRERKLIEKSGK